MKKFICNENLNDLGYPGAEIYNIMVIHERTSFPQLLNNFTTIVRKPFNPYLFIFYRAPIYDQLQHENSITTLEATIQNCIKRADVLKLSSWSSPCNNGLMASPRK